MATIVALGGGHFDNGEMYTVAEHIVSLSGKAHPSVVFLPTAVGGQRRRLWNTQAFKKACARLSIKAPERIRSCLS